MTIRVSNRLFEVNTKELKKELEGLRQLREDLIQRNFSNFISDALPLVWNIPFKVVLMGLRAGTTCGLGILNVINGVIAVFLSGLSL